MATLLTTSKMAPELARRIEASVHGRGRAPGGHAAGRRFVSIVRFAMFATIAVAFVTLLRLRRQENAELDRTRAELLAAIRKESASLAPEHRDALSRIEPWLVRSSGVYEGDRIAPEVAAAGALRAALSQPLVYVRGTTSTFDGSAGIAAAAATSLKDPLLVCLLSPPESRDEKGLLERVRAAYAGGARVEAKTPNAHRLYDLVAGLPLLLPPWEARVQKATEMAELLRLKRELSAAPLESAKQAARARLLLFAMDDPGAPGGLSELDGERPHDVRVGLVDLAAGTVLFRLLRHVDPSFVSVGRRAQYASGLDGCALALAVQDAVGAAH